MTQNKYSPWLDEEAERPLFNLDLTHVEMAISRRSVFDYDYGLRFKGGAIRARNWSVGFLLEEALSEDREMFALFATMNKSKESLMLAIPSEEIGFELTGKHDVLESFEPPLIAVSKISMESFIRIRSSMVQILRGSFFIFPEDDSAALLCVNGKYKMLAGPRDFVERILGVSIEASWRSILEKKEIDPCLVHQMKQAMAAYGILS